MTHRIVVDIAEEYLDLDKSQIAELNKAIVDFVKGVAQPKVDAELYKPVYVHSHRHHSTERSSCEHCYAAAGDEIEDPSGKSGKPNTSFVLDI